MQLATGNSVLLAVSPVSEVSLRDKLTDILSELHDEYLEQHEYPWIVGYSGGKDSTLVLQLVFEMLLRMAPCDRLRDVHVVSNDTLVESPLIMDHVVRNMDRINAVSTNLGLPIITTITRPAIDQTFWVNLIGRGYPSPKQNFRWCTDRMKIEPTSAYIRGITERSNGSIVLLGVREQESSARAAATKKFSSAQRLHPHVKLRGCNVFRPILNLSTDEVWHTLLQRKISAWEVNFRELITLYRNAEGGECPTVTDKSEAAACGTGSARFGCWTCTVVQKDRSLAGLIDSGYDSLEPLLDFRDWLISIRDDHARRMTVRRNGKTLLSKSNSIIPGPFTVKARREILAKLLQASVESGRELISRDEIRLIRRIWANDTLRDLGGIIYSGASAGARSKR